jgi:hypothetical protein
MICLIIYFCCCSIFTTFETELGSLDVLRWRAAEGVTVWTEGKMEHEVLCCVILNRNYFFSSCLVRAQQSLITAIRQRLRKMKPETKLNLPVHWSHPISKRKNCIATRLTFYDSLANNVKPQTKLSTSWKYFSSTNQQPTQVKLRNCTLKNT